MFISFIFFICVNIDNFVDFLVFNIVCYVLDFVEGVLCSRYFFLLV